MTIQESDARQGSKRILMSLLLALLFHGTAFVLIQWVFPFRAEEAPEYSGPIYVIIEEFEPEPVAAPAKIEKAAEVTPPEIVQKKEATPEKEVTPATPAVEPRTFIQAPVRLDSGKAPKTIPPETVSKKPLPPTTPEVTEEVPAEGISDIVTPKPEQEAVPAGTESPPVEKQPEIRPAIPPQFLTAQEEEKPLMFNMARLDEALKEKEEEQAIKGEGKEPGEQVPGGEVSLQKGPVITWDEPGEERILMSKSKDPEIPQWVQKEGLNLNVVVSFAVTPEGHTISLKVERSSGYSDVDTAVLEVVRKLKFNPVSVDKKVRGRINYIIKTR